MSILIGALLLGLAISIIVFVIIIKKQKQKIPEKEKENLQKELELKNRDLICNVSKIYTKNLMINKVARTFTKSTEHFKQANIGMIKDIIGELQHNMDRTSWVDFETRFAKVHGGFYKALDEQFPDLTNSEPKLCAMLKLGLSSKEIAAITMVHSESADTARSLLRKKHCSLFSHLHLRSTASQIVVGQYKRCHGLYDGYCPWHYANIMASLGF